MNQEKFCEALRLHIVKKHGRQSAAAKAWGVSGGFVSMVLRGKKTPTETMLKEIGLKRVQPEVRYVRRKEGE
jgi:hypothetical protein